MPVGDVAVLRIIGRYQDQNIVNVMHYRVMAQTGPDQTLWDTLCAEWSIQHSVNFLLRHLDAYELIGLKAFTVKGDSVPPGVEIIGVNGAVVADPQEAYVCRTITLYTASINPRERGRLQLSGGAETQFDDTTGSVSSAEVGLLTILGTSLLAILDDGVNQFMPCVYNRVTFQTHDLVRAKGRVTPSLIRSRRIKQFMIG